MRHYYLFFLISFLFFFSGPTHASLRTGPIASAMGGAGVAAINPSESASLNPAVLPHIKRYYMSFFYSGYESLSEPSQNQRGLVLTDGKAENVFPASLNYSERRWLTAGTSPIEETLLAVSVGRFVFRGFSFGLTVRHLSQKRLNSSKKSHMNGSVGVLFTPTPLLGIAFVINDLLGKTDEFPERQYYPGFTTGIHYFLTSFFRARLDISHEIQDHGLPNKVMVGIETYPYKQWPFRFGIQKDNINPKTLLTAGTGWTGPRLSFDYALQTQTEPTYSVNHTIDMKLHF